MKNIFILIIYNSYYFAVCARKRNKKAQLNFVERNRAAVSISFILRIGFHKILSVPNVVVNKCNT